MAYEFTVVPVASMQTFPPNNGGGRGQGYQTLGGPTGIYVIKLNLSINEIRWLFLFLFIFFTFLLLRNSSFLGLCPDYTHLYDL